MELAPAQAAALIHDMFESANQFADDAEVSIGHISHFLESHLVMSKTKKHFISLEELDFLQCFQLNFLRKRKQAQVGEMAV